VKIGLRFLKEPEAVKAAFLVREGAIHLKKRKIFISIYLFNTLMKSKELSNLV
jgi:hypothetical protein